MIVLQYFHTLKRCSSSSDRLDLCCIIIRISFHPQDSLWLFLGSTDLSNLNLPSLRLASLRPQRQNIRSSLSLGKRPNTAGVHRRYTTTTLTDCSVLKTLKCYLVFRMCGNTGGRFKTLLHADNIVQSKVVPQGNLTGIQTEYNQKFNWNTTRNVTCLAYKPLICV